MQTLPTWMRNRFAPHHVRHNPFGAATQAELASLTLSDIPHEPMVQRLAKAPDEGRVAYEFVGPCGHGKSTHLGLLHSYFHEMPRTLLRPDVRAPRIPRAPIVFLDESQRLPRWRRRLLFRRHAHFVLGTHHPHAAELRSAGIEVVQHFVGRLDQHRFRRRLDAFIAGRLAWAATGTGDPPTIPSPMLDKLVEEHGQHLRAIQNDLYDWFQELL